MASSPLGPLFTRHQDRPKLERCTAVERRDLAEAQEGIPPLLQRHRRGSIQQHHRIWSTTFPQEAAREPRRIL